MRRWLALSLLIPSLLVLGAATGLAVPWPGGAPPSAVELRSNLDDATLEWSDDRFIEWRSSQENEVDQEVALVGQGDIDDGSFDLEGVVLYGHRLFQASWRADMGLGSADRDSQIQRVHLGDRPGPDAHSCDGCHMQGGQDGAGSFAESAMLHGDGDRQSSAILRNPPAMLGAGLVGALAAEMSASLSKHRDDAIAQAAAEKNTVRAPLSAKGVSFGFITARPDGGLDLSEISGVDADLVVKPFGWKGSFASVRAFVEDAARNHLSVQSEPMVQRTAAASLAAGLDPTDPDGDGVRRELEEGSLTMLTVYVLLLETPQLVPPQDPGLQARFSDGSGIFDQVGCGSCHLRSLHLDDRIWYERAQSPDAAPVRLNLLADGDQPRGNDQVGLFSDLRRHTMGPALAEARPYDGIATDVWLTRPLWGLADSAPYLHDGRATTIPDAILAHGGEAQAARDAFAALSPEKQADLHIFLLGLSRAPTLRVAR